MRQHHGFDCTIGRRQRRFLSSCTRKWAIVTMAVICAVGPALYPASAGADVVSPAGACVGSGKWQRAGLSETSTAHQPSDVIDVPQADTVEWAGNIKGFAVGTLGPRRNTSGSVQLDLPFTSVTIDKWGGSSVRYANAGTHKYDLPSVLVGIKMKLHGQDIENGSVLCAGSVFVRVKGKAFSNPLLWVALGLMVVSGGVLLVAGRPVFSKIWAFEDVNPG